MERCHLCGVVTGCVDYGYSMTPINVSKKISPDSTGTLVRPWLRRCRHSQTSFRGQARVSENTGLGILARCTSRGRRGTLEPVMRYFVAGAGFGRFDSQRTVNTTVNTQSTRQSTRALFLRILSRSADLDSCSPYHHLLWPRAKAVQNPGQIPQPPRWRLRIAADACKIESSTKG